MEKIHIGDRIQRQMYRKDMRPGDLAKRLGVARQTLYDIFESQYISTRKLIQLCEILDHDFFSDLSTAYGRSDDRLIADALDEGFCNLIEESELPVVNSAYRLRRILKQFEHSDGTQPLVVFYDYDRTERLPTTHFFELICKNCNCERSVEEIVESSDDASPLCLAQSDRLSVYLFLGTDYQGALKEMEKEISKKQRHIIMLIPVINELKKGINGGIEYHGIADDLFKMWRKLAHLVLIARNYGRRRELYRAYLGDGIFDRMARRYIVNDEIERQLVELTLGEEILEFAEDVDENKDGVSTICLSYPPATKDELELLHNNGVNNNPKLSMWIRVCGGKLFDYQYRK